MLVRTIDISQAAPKAPYNEVQFYKIMANTLADENSLLSGWAEYSTACFSHTPLPAILYKMRDLTYLKSKFYMDNKWNEMKTEGCVYNPYHHNWDVNSIWVLGHIHRGSKFVVMSDLTEAYAKRSGNRNIYSAFAKEIATTIKAGYAISSVTHIHGRFVTYLEPTQSKSQALLATVNSCQVSDDDCEIAFIKFNESKFRYIAATFKISPSVTINTSSKNETKAKIANDAMLGSKVISPPSSSSSGSSIEMRSVILYTGVLFHLPKNSSHAKKKDPISSDVEKNSDPSFTL